MAYEHIKNLLEEHGETQTELARILGRTQAVVTNLFNGTRSLQIEEVQKLAMHFNRSTDYILYGKEYSKKPEETLADKWITQEFNKNIRPYQEKIEALSSVLDALLYEIAELRREGMLPAQKPGLSKPL